MQIYNTLTRKKEPFVPLKEGEVGIYACGPTVYNFFHIGNARPFILFDTLRRYFEYRGYKVTLVQNFTDIDDKMIRRAGEEGKSVAQVAEKYIKEYFIDADGLGIKRATAHPKATEHIPEIITMIERLMQNGLAYEADGDVYYRAKKFSGYGKLSGQPLENLEMGARIEPGERKEDAMDFALWKAQKPGEPAWDSPWGKGRPGWHIECSAMSTKYLGDTFDIHCGGQDLIFPHHENEIAQSEGATGKPFARYWMHNGYINVDNQKMSKSLGNFFTVRDISEKYDLEVVRLFMLFAHYRNPVSFGGELLEQARSALERLYNTKTRIGEALGQAAADNGDEAAFAPQLAEFRQRFCDAMDDDLNTADALGVVFDLCRAVNSFLSEARSKAVVLEIQACFDELTGVLGLAQKQKEAFSGEIMALVEARTQARAQKDWARSDEIRDQLKALGVTVEDTANGPRIKHL